GEPALDAAAAVILAVVAAEAFINELGESALNHSVAFGRSNAEDSRIATRPSTQMPRFLLPKVRLHATVGETFSRQDADHGHKTPRRQAEPHEPAAPGLPSPGPLGRPTARRQGRERPSGVQ